ncbi:hypothetical protein GCM10029964_062310 [Kibdelosporangium lantanae]
MARKPVPGKVVIVGGGTAGLMVAARLRRAGARDVTVLDPAVTHYYQPLWTLVAAGRSTSGSPAGRSPP